MTAMNGMLKKIAVAFLSLALMTPMVDAQNHRTSGNRGGNHPTAQRPANSGNNRPTSTRPSSRPSSGNSSNNNSNGNHGNYRPGNNGNSTRPNRPGNNGNHNNGNRPGNNGNHNNGNRPGNNGNHNNGNRPGNNGNHNHGNRPGNNGNHNHGNRPGRPGNEWHFGRPNGGSHGHVTPPRPGGSHRPPMIAPPIRPHRPIAHGWTRPVPPPAWRPRPHAPSISAILGITFGTALNLSLDYLYGRGYVVDGYGDNRVYLRDVNQFNYYWPDATLYYGNNGLVRSEFLYSTSYPDMMRYTALYNSLTGTYGAPVNYVTSGASVTATWFAPNSGYVTLQYAPQYSIGGALRYFTTITFGL